MTLRPIALAVLLAAPAARAADSGMLELVPPGATFVLGMRVRSLLDSPSGKSLAAEARQAGAQWNAALAAAGFDPLQDVDDVLLAATGSGKNTPGLVIARGRFQAARDRAAGTAYNGVVVSGKRDSSIAFPDETLMVAGDLAMVRAAIDRRGRGAAGEMSARAAEMAGRYDIFGFGAIPPDAVPEGGAGAAAKGIDRFQFGIGIGRDLELAAELHARTAQDAQGLAQTIALATSMLGQQKGAEDLAKHLSVRMEGETLKIQLSLPEAQLRRAIQAHSGAVPGRPGRSLPAVPQATPETAAGPPPPARRDPRFAPDTVMTITGSDGEVTVVTDPKKP